MKYFIIKIFINELAISFQMNSKNECNHWFLNQSMNRLKEKEKQRKERNKKDKESIIEWISLMNQYLFHRCLWILIYNTYSDDCSLNSIPKRIQIFIQIWIVIKNQRKI